MTYTTSTGRVVAACACSGRSSDRSGRLRRSGEATPIASVVEALRIHPYLGRVAPEPGIRELVIGGTPYTILYRVRANRLIISTISHAS
ncbi:MAG TPA: type II toxin-antitoxin system RelE/ParE family toxin [Candidatus Acidoferrum sp.]|nr:type II toxin-antitoxin system RelE/ParE family toxin [Candidatus Acidoferrum sp.]